MVVAGVVVDDTVVVVVAIVVLVLGAYVVEVDVLVEAAVVGWDVLAEARIVSPKSGGSVEILVLGAYVVEVDVLGAATVVGWDVLAETRIVSPRSGGSVDILEVLTRSSEGFVVVSIPNRLGKKVVRNVGKNELGVVETGSVTLVGVDVNLGVIDNIGRVVVVAGALVVDVVVRLDVV